MSVYLRSVAFEYAAQTWPQVEHFIERMMKYGPCDHTLDQMKMRVCTGDWRLLIFVDENELPVGALTVVLQQFPNDLIGFVTAAGGKGFFNKDGYKQLTDHLRALGATRIQSYTRPSMARLSRLCGMTEAATLMDAPL